MGNDKLNGIPNAYILTLEGHKSRQEETVKLFNLYGIQNYEFVYGYNSKIEDFKNNHPLVEGIFFDNLSQGDIACSMGHLKMIKHWCDTSDSEYAIFFEDDIDLSLCEYWNFNWNDVLEILPKDWNVIQLSIIKENINDSDFKINVREDRTWSVVAYVMNKNYAKFLIWSYIREEKYCLRLLQEPVITVPVVEDILFFPSMSYGGYGGGYTFPIFTERLNSISTLLPTNSPITMKEANVYSAKKIHDWWKNNGVNMDIDFFRLK